jgi:sulfite reductase (NADPH) flavoprotein alpha-component
MTVLYGSQTGNARRVAEQLAAQAEQAGQAVRLLRADAYPLRELKDERWLSVVISTQGEGDPPEDALALFEFLESRRAPSLKGLRFAVLALGDSSYPKFCAVGHRLDARLAELGAERLRPCVEVDVEIEPVAAPWRAELLEQIRGLQAEAGQARGSVTPLRRVGQVMPAESKPSVHRDAPVALPLLAQQRVVGRTSEKDVRHLEFDLAGSGISYLPGDALGIWPRQPQAVVDRVIAAAGLQGEDSASLHGRELPLASWLAEHREPLRAGRGLLQVLAERHADPVLRAALETPERAAAWLAATTVPAALRRWPVAWTAQDLVAALRPLTPRLYSIASSAAEVGEEVHLTVDHLRYTVDGQGYGGTASAVLAALAEGDSVRAFVQPNEHFRLPADAKAPLIMIGAGTGIAPYRGFLQQRVSDGASGRNWLLFGAQRFASDFLYQAEWLKARKAGKLARIDLAFSRDAQPKVYVQQRVREQGRNVYAWLQEGAHLYVCGSIAMGREVHQALLDVLQAQAGLDGEAAEAYLRELQKAGRYSRDVY